MTGARRILIRDLAQVATPAGTAAPLRGAALGELDLVEDAFVLLADEVIEAVGPMRALPRLDAEVEELDGHGLSVVPGLVDCHTHPAFAGDRAHEFALRARGASYEELLAAGGGILSTTRATRAVLPDGRMLLVRDLAQVVTPVGTQAPLRGGALRDVDVIEDAFVLARDGVFESIGRMRDLPPLDGDVEEADGHELCAIPGLVDCHTHPAFAGDRANEFALRAGGATYEELLAAGGGILSTTRATRAAGVAELREIVAHHRDSMLAHGTTTFEGKSGYGLDRDTELAQLAVSYTHLTLPTILRV